jgi:hypothetical protein
MHVRTPLITSTHDLALCLYALLLDVVCVLPHTAIQEGDIQPSACPISDLFNNTLPEKNPWVRFDTVQPDRILVCTMTGKCQISQFDLMFMAM